jgi:hypothetical protein
MRTTPTTANHLGPLQSSGLRNGVDETLIRSLHFFPAKLPCHGGILEQGSSLQHRTATPFPPRMRPVRSLPTQVSTDKLNVLDFCRRRSEILCGGPGGNSWDELPSMLLVTRLPPGCITLACKVNTVSQLPPTSPHLSLCLARLHGMPHRNISYGALIGAGNRGTSPRFPDNLKCALNGLGFSFYPTEPQPAKETSQTVNPHELLLMTVYQSWHAAKR